MISKCYITKRFCCEPLSNVENYEVAVNSPVRYDLHHRDEIKILPSGVEVRRSREELKEIGRYFKCPANELIFLPHPEHMRMHNSDYGNPMYGKPRPEGEMSSTWKGDDASEITKRYRRKPYRSPEAHKLRRLKRKQRNAERVQAIQETKGVL